MEASFFGEPALFGAYHPPVTVAARPVGVLLCPPVGHEHPRSCRALRALAEALARAGHHALRFDYSGVGDSSGEFEASTVERWCDDVAAALEELAELSGVREVHVVGLRLGAALAVRSLSRAGRRRSRTRLGGITLWDPVLSGAEFLENADRLNAAFVNDAARFPRLRTGHAPPPDTGTDRLGYGYPPALRDGLLALDLRDPEGWPALPVRFVLSRPLPDVQVLVCRLEQPTRPVATVEVTGVDGDWDDYAGHERTLRAGLAVRAIVDAVGEGRS